MGIDNGYVITGECIRGIYKHDAKNYNIYVDGELVRYKGMVDENMHCPNPEVAIAETAKDYLIKLVRIIQCHLKCDPRKVIIFMDGIRVFNKETRSYGQTINLNHNDIRQNFILMCTQVGYCVNSLVEGEAELQMYLQRDTSMDLNVFVTSDTDMLSICYNHIPQTVFPFRDATRYKKQQPNVYDANHKLVKDFNCHYPNDTIIKDSCVWVNINRDSYTFIGFDGLQFRLLFKPKVFRIFVALCGTDFTHFCPSNSKSSSSVLSQTMIKSILQTSITDINLINKLDDIHQITAALIWCSLKHKVTLPRLNVTEDESRVEDFIKMISMYLEYIEKGEMEQCIITKPNLTVILRQYIYAITGDDDFQIKTLNSWCKNHPLRLALQNLEKNFGKWQQPKLNSKRKTINALEGLSIPMKQFCINITDDASSTTNTNEIPPPKSEPAKPTTKPDRRLKIMMSEDVMAMLSVEDIDDQTPTQENVEKKQKMPFPYDEI